MSGAVRAPAAPWLSILVPVYNVQDYLEECLTSVVEQLPQLQQSPNGVAGVAILVVANTEAPEMVADVPVEGILGRGYTTTTLPEIETGEAFIDTVLPVPAAQNITQTKLPALEEDEL